MGAVGGNTGGNQQAICKDSAFVGNAITIGIPQHNDLVVGYFSWLDLRVNSAARHPQTASGIEIHLDWLADVRVRREKIERRSIIQLHRFQFGSCVRLGDVRQVSLCMHVARDRGCKDRGCKDR